MIIIITYKCDSPLDTVKNVYAKTATIIYNSYSTTIILRCGRIISSRKICRPEVGTIIVAYPQK